MTQPAESQGATAEDPMQWQARIEQLLYDEQLAATLALYGAHDATAADLQPVGHLGLPPQAAGASAPPIWCSHNAAQKSQIEEDARLAAQLAGHGVDHHQPHQDQQTASDLAEAALGLSSHPIDLCSLEEQQWAEHLMDQDREAILLRDQQLAQALHQEEHDLAAQLQTSFNQDAICRSDELLVQELVQELQARSSADGSTSSSRAQSDVPCHWDFDATSGNAVRLLELPLPGQEGAPQLPSDIDPWALMQLVEQGILPKDAAAALLASNGNADNAQALALEWQGSGGVSELTHLSDPETAAKLEVWAGMAESQRALERFSSGGMRRQAVKRIERVQNPILWRRFALRRQELQDKHGPEGANESLLFHGADKATLEAVINEGFDIRVANQGSLGQGTYFAQDSVYSAAYSKSQGRAALNASEVQHLQQHLSEGQAARPAFLSDGNAMLLCRVALGKVAKGSQALRRPPPGYESVSNAPEPPHNCNTIYAVFDNNSSLPEYVVHFQ